MAGFQGLTFTVYPVVAADGVTLNASITTSTVVGGILDPVSGINRMYNPTSVGLVPASSDTPGTWLPTVSAISALGVLDNYWVPAGASPATNPKLGQVSLTLKAATKDTVRASSVMNFRLSTNAFVIAATGGTF